MLVLIPPMTCEPGLLSNNEKSKDISVESNYRNYVTWNELVTWHYFTTKLIHRFHTIVVDGHSVPDLLEAFKTAKNVKNKPTALICKTFKGHGGSAVADKLDFHGEKRLWVEIISPTLRSTPHGTGVMFLSILHFMNFIKIFKIFVGTVNI